jgi:hypothetical protein
VFYVCVNGLFLSSCAQKELCLSSVGKVLTGSAILAVLRRDNSTQQSAEDVDSLCCAYYLHIDIVSV